MYSGTYAHADTQCPYSTSDVAARSSFPSLLPLPLLTIPNPDPLAAIAEFDSVKPPCHYPDVSHSGTSSSGGSSCYSSPSSFPSAETRSGPSLFQRSISSVSLQRKDGGYYHYSPLAVSALELAESETSPVRRVYSTGDLQRVNGLQHKQRSESPLMSESNMIIEGMSRACRYSPEEKKERIERYRSKRNQRNFNKKIKYACRKTLADSRPRIRGRFARNDEIDKCDQLPWSHEAGGEDEEEDEDDNWVNFLDSFASGNL
ncbi:putative zinc finger protein CONSTANS-LIKE 11 [Syzygium oleosum]|uniref:putative zinc finger protein CONSTANS-LIKE 11 n=1 Tax=Syzygium oleosum TaxID=219896 RepID=UPI0024BA331F|nr:putative zinc finger protein CONSTANS-LIKE 11 [Syzygium oleosum]